MKDLKALHSKLGEPITDEEAQESIAELDPQKTGEIAFNELSKWFLEFGFGFDLGLIWIWFGFGFGFGLVSKPTQSGLRN